MRRLIYILICFVYIFSNCNREISQGSLLLVEAEKWMMESPEKSLNLLEGVNTDYLSDGEYALWSLLTTQAWHKNYITFHSDSLIRIAVDYFEKDKDNPLLMKAYYYHAIVLEELGDIVQAQDRYLDALERGEYSDDHLLLGHINTNLGILYLYQGLYDTALLSEKRALHHFTIADYSTGKGIVFRNIGRIYTVKLQPDSATCYYQEAMMYTNSVYSSSIYAELGSLYGEQGNYPEALRFLQEASKLLQNADDTATVALAYADIYMNRRMRDSTLHYLQYCIDSPDLFTKAASYFIRASLEENNGDWLAYATYNKEHIRLRDSIDNLNQDDLLQRMQSLYDYRLIERDKNYFEKESHTKTVYIYRLILLLALAGFTAIFLFFLDRNRRLKLKEQQDKSLLLAWQKYEKSEEFHREVVENMERLLSSKSILLSEAQRELLLIKQQQAKIMTGLSQNSEIEEKKLFTSTYYSHLRSSKMNMKSDEKEELITRVNLAYNGFTNNLKAILPTISDFELQVSCLVKIKIPVSQIANLLSKTESAISQCRRRLYSKLTGKKGNTSDFDSYISDL